MDAAAVRTTVRGAFAGWRVALSDRPTRIYTVTALAPAVAFVTIAFIWHALFYFDLTAAPLPDALTPWHDDSVPEYVEALLTILGAGFLLRAWLITGDGLLGAWGLVLAVMAADNRLRLHETVGHALASTLDPFGFGPIEGRHVGELAFWALCGAGFVVVFALGARTRTPLGVRASIVLGTLLLVLLHFAGGYDILHVLTKSNLVGFVEDGGEFVCIALVSGYAFGVMRTAPSLRRHPPASA